MKSEDIYAADDLIDRYAAMSGATLLKTFGEKMVKNSECFF